MRRKLRAQLRYVRRNTVVIPSDVNGSYTGVVTDGARERRNEEPPVQDADDL